MKEESAIILDDFLAENWIEWEQFCNARDTDAELVYVEVQEHTGQY